MESFIRFSKNTTKLSESLILKFLTTVALLILNFSLFANGKPFFGPPTKQYHHWSNTDAVWINGALQQNNSNWQEGDIVPHVYTPDTKNWTSGTKSIVVHYDYSRTVGGVTTGGFFALVDQFSPPGGFYGETPQLAGDLYATSNISNIVVTDLSPIVSSNHTIYRKQIIFSFTGNNDDEVAIYFGLQLATANDDNFDQGSGQWPGASLQTSLDGDGSRTLSLNLGPTVTCTNIDASIAGDASACLNDAQPSITFSASNGDGPFTFEYTVNGGESQFISTNPGQNSVTLDVPTDAEGEFEYQLISVAGQFCSNEASGSATINVYPKPDATISGGGADCDGQTVTITFTGTGGTAPYTFYYNGPSGASSILSDDNGIATINVTIVGTVTYTLTGVSDGHCSNDASGEASATIYPKPHANMEIGSASVCKGDAVSITFTGSGGTKPYTFNYTDPAGQALSIQTTGNNSTVTLNVPTSASGTYNYKLTGVADAHCSNTEDQTVSLVVKPLPEVSFNVAASCAATPTLLSATIVNQLIVTSYQWYINGSPAGTNQTLTISNGAAGSSKTVKIVVTGQNGCSNSYEQVINATACAQNTLTQGFYGNTNGKACPDNSTALTILGNWLSAAGGTRVIGIVSSPTILTGGYNTKGPGTLTIVSADVSALNTYMPGSSTPNRINTVSTLNPNYTVSSIPKNSNKIADVLITQVITLGINLQRFPANKLGDVIIEPAKYATVVKSATKCVIPTSCSGGTITSTNMTGVSSAFATYLNGKNIQYLYTLANEALGGANLPTGVTYGDINAAIDFYNKLFDGGVLYLGNFDTKQTTCGQARGVNPEVVETKVLKPELNNVAGVSAYPNPFTDRVRFTIHSPKAGRAILEVYNNLGQRIGVAFEGQLSAGEIRSVEFKATVVGQSSLYFIFRINEEQVTGKVMHASQ